MKYQSTRGGIKEWTFEQALFSGYLSDGGLAFPKIIPKIDASVLKSWVNLSYVEILKNILPYYIGEDEISLSVLHTLLDNAFKSFSCPELVKLKRLSQELNILELFHGPTLAFKDLSLCVVGQLFDYFLSKRQKHVTVIVATAGDTGSAVIQAFKGLQSVDAIVLLPKGRVSRIQELQMTTVIEDNVHIYRGDCSCDDLDISMKAIFKDKDFAAEHNLCCLNSINWARVMVQIAHYFYIYFQMSPDFSDVVEVVVPTGGCGNVAAGVIAAEMGLPIKLVCAVSTNDIIARTVNHGDICAPYDVTPSLATALDTGYPYNVERMLYLLSDYDSELTKNILEEFERSKKSVIPNDLLQKLQKVVKGHVVNDESIKSAMVQCWQKNQYLLCPHTAVAAKYHYDHRNTNDMPRVCVATASPAKFEEAVTSAGLVPQPTESIKKLDSMKTRYTDLEKGKDFEQILKNKIVEISKKVKFQ